MSGMARQVVDGQGKIMSVPEGWELLPPGDGPLTRQVKARAKAAGDSVWVVQVKRGRRTFSQGIWTAACHITQAKGELEKRRSEPAHKRQLEQARQRREEKQQDYVEDFKQAVLDFLAFHPANRELADEMADAVTRHATPVGSGTVARTSRIPLAQRARSAVIAWLRHHTTRYDHMNIARVKGVRRQVRRDLAEKSLDLLQQYRRGEAAAGDDGSAPDSCPLRKAIWKIRIEQKVASSKKAHPLSENVRERER